MYMFEFGSVRRFSKMHTSSKGTPQASQAGSCTMPRPIILVFSVFFFLFSSLKDDFSVFPNHFYWQMRRICPTLVLDETSISTRVYT
jgi:hypothetical protein